MRWAPSLAAGAGHRLASSNPGAVLVVEPATRFSRRCARHATKSKRSTWRRSTTSRTKHSRTEEKPPVKPLDVNDLTIGDLEDFEEAAGVSFQEAFKATPQLDGDGKVVVDDKTGEPVMTATFSAK